MPEELKGFMVVQRGNWQPGKLSTEVMNNMVVFGGAIRNAKNKITGRVYVFPEDRLPYWHAREIAQLMGLIPSPQPSPRVIVPSKAQAI